MGAAPPHRPEDPRTHVRVVSGDQHMEPITPREIIYLNTSSTINPTPTRPTVTFNLTVDPFFPKGLTIANQFREPVPIQEAIIAMRNLKSDPPTPTNGSKSKEQAKNGEQC